MNPDLDYLSGDTWVSGELPGVTRWLRHNAPVYWSETNGLWIVTKFADVAAVSKNPEVFCSGEGVLPGIPVRQGLIDEDDPKHTALRRLINKGFTPRMVAKLEEAFVEITTEAIDAVVGAGECDFVEDIAVPLPLLIIAEMIGIRKEDRRRFHRWSDAMMAGAGNFDDPEVMAAAGAAFGEYAQYVSEIIEDRKANPQDDLVSILIGAKDSGLLEKDLDYDAGRGSDAGDMALANDELTMMLVTLLTAGNETTRNALSGAVELLIRHPEVREELAEHPEKIPDAVEEMLRLVSPVLAFARTATRDTELRGQKIAKGDKVLMLYPSANRDEDEYEAPDEFRIDRKPHHVAFGIGAHFCLGANLARMELRVALREVLRRMPDMEFAVDGPEFQPNALVRSCSRMQVRFSPSSG